MRKALYLSLLFFFSTLFAAPIVAQQNWYVRVDGAALYSAGNPAGGCDGKADAAYPGSGVNRHCAMNDIGYLDYDGTYTTVTKWVISGGDIVHIGPGKFRCGYRGPNPVDHNGLAMAGSPNANCFPGVPSGTAANPTQFIGAGQGQTQIYGGYSAGAIFGLGGAGFIVISGIELTDHAQCSRVGTGPQCSSDYPLDDYAQNGITTDTSTHDITLKDLNIHGFTSRGILGPIGGLVTVDHVRIAFNGAAGWDFDDGNGTPSVNGSVKATFLTVEGNGCNEEYPIVHTPFPAASCFDQDHGGYGDGVGTPGTPLNFSCDQCIFRYNTQDGLDLLHTHGSSISVTNSTSYGNMGQQWKMGAMQSVDFENNTTVHNCNRLSAPMPGRTDTFAGLSLFCRAGDGIAFNIVDGGTYTFKHNSYVGYSSASYDIGCGGAGATCTKPNVVYEDNVNLGYPSPFNQQPPLVFYWTNDTTQNAWMQVTDPILTADHNIYYNMLSTPVQGDMVDPRFVGEPAWTGESSLDNFNFALSANSPAIALGAGASITPVSVQPPVTPPVVVPPVTPPPVQPPPTTHTVTMTITVDGQPVTLTGSY